MSIEKYSFAILSFQMNFYLLHGRGVMPINCLEIYIVPFTSVLRAGWINTWKLLKDLSLHRMRAFISALAG